MKASVLWTSPNPERTIAVAMRRCFSTKPIEEIEAELEQKGPDYWKYLLTKALQDKSLDVLEHFTMTFLVEDAPEGRMGNLAISFPYLRATNLKGDDWMVSFNARTLVEMWKDQRGKDFAGLVISELDRIDVCPIFSGLAFGERVHAG